MYRRFHEETYPEFSPRRKVVVFTLLIGTLVLFWQSCMPKLGSGVTREGLLALRPGLTEAQVIQLIGKPISRHKTYRPHPIGEKTAWEGQWSWIYGEQGFLDFGPGYEISVGFRDGRMTGAAAERFDLGIWWCWESACPVVWNKEAFAELP